MESEEESKRKLRVKERRHYTEDCLQDDEIEGRRMFSVEEKLQSTRFEACFVKMMKGEELSLKYFQEHGFETPMLFKDKANLGMRMPSHNFTCNDVRQCVGSRRMLDVMDVTTQKDIEMSMKDWCRYFENTNREKLLNVISLEFSHTKLENYVESPSIVRQVDWVDVVWPRHLKESQTEGTNAIEDMKYPKVQKYCLMSVKGCYTDFHVDFGGTSVWYHILRGQKVFWLIPPTEKNMLLYEQWVLSGKQGDVFFGDTVEKCARVELGEGDTFFIPTGWIHAVYTPMDTIVFGGNFLHSYGIEKQLRVSEIEDATHVPVKFRYPFYREMLWYVLQRYVYCLKGVNYMTCNEEGEPLNSADSSIDTKQENCSIHVQPESPTVPQNLSMKDSARSSSPQGDDLECGKLCKNHVVVNGHRTIPLDCSTPKLSKTVNGFSDSGHIHNLLPGIKKEFSPSHVHLTQLEINGLKAIIRFLQKMPSNKRFVPDLLKDPDSLLEDAKTLLNEHLHDDPQLAITDKPVLFWSESLKKKTKPKSSTPSTKAPKSASKSSSDKNSARRRRTRCKKCEACLRADCGDCHFCKDMKKFGGPGRMKQSCISRQCMAPVLPHTACCMICGRDGWEKVPHPVDHESSSLMECSQCWEIVHPQCLHEQQPDLPLEGNINDDLPNSWECPKCCRDGKPDQVKPRQSRVNRSKGVDQKPDVDALSSSVPNNSVGGDETNPAINLSMKDQEKILSDDGPPPGSPPKKRIKVEVKEEPEESSPASSPEDSPLNLHRSASKMEVTEEDSNQPKSPDQTKQRKEDFVKSCSRYSLGLELRHKKKETARDRLFRSLRGLRKNSDLCRAMIRIRSNHLNEGKLSRTSLISKLHAKKDKEDQEPNADNENNNNNVNNSDQIEKLADSDVNNLEPTLEPNFRMTLRDRVNLRKPKFVVRPAPILDDPAEKLKSVEEDGSVNFALRKEVMLPVFKFLTKSDLFNCQLVCKLWNRWCTEPALWARMDLSRCKLTPAILEGIVRRQPASLNLGWTNISKRQLSWLLPRLPQLRELILCGCAAAAVTAMCTSSCPMLRSLDLSWVEGLGDSVIRDLMAPPPDPRPGCPEPKSRLRYLVEIRLSGTEISDISVRMLGHHLPLLCRLDLSHCRKVTDMGIAVLGAAKASRLTALDVSSCINISDTSLEALRRCTSLQHLDLRDCQQVTKTACQKFVTQSRMPMLLKDCKLIQRSV